MARIEASNLGTFEIKYLQQLARRNHVTSSKLAGILISRGLTMLRSADAVGWCPGDPAPTPRIPVKKKHPVKVRKYHKYQFAPFLKKLSRKQIDQWILTGDEGVLYQSSD